MKIIFIEESSDHDKPVIDITAENLNDSFLLGVLFEQMVSKNLCVWNGSIGNITLRIPLVEMNDIGLATTYHNTPPVG